MLTLRALGSSFALEGYEANQVAAHPLPGLPMHPPDKLASGSMIVPRSR